MNVVEMINRKYEAQKPEYSPIERTTLTANEVAEYLGVSRDLVYKLVRENKIVHVKIGSRILFRKASIDQWLEELESYGHENAK